MRCIEVHVNMFIKKCLDLKHYPMKVLVISCNSMHFCQTPNPVKNWELSLLSLANKKKRKQNNKKNNPHLISHRRVFPRVVRKKKNKTNLQKIVFS